MNHLKTIAHVCIKSADLARTLDFYCGALGMDRQFNFTRHGRVIGVYLKLAERSFIEVFEAEGVVPPTNQSALHHFCLESDDLEAVRARLAERGFAPDDIRIGADASRQFWVSDPSGVRFEFHQCTAASAQLNPAVRRGGQLVKQSPLIIAHRGASARAPENTLAAVRLAWELAADAVEVDVHLTGDGRVVVIHDARTRRTTGVDLRVADSTLEHLQALDAGGWKDEIWSGERIPTLADVLATVPPGRRLVIELKVGPEIVAPLAQDIAAAVAGEPTLAASQIVLIAFDREVAVLAKSRLPDVCVLWLGDPRRRSLRARPSSLVRRMAAQARDFGLDGLDLFAHRCVNVRLVDEIHALGLLVYVWTVNRPRTCERIFHVGVDGITTNHPDVMLRLRDAGLPQKE